MPAAARACAGANASPGANLKRASAATLCLLNRQRKAHGLRPLRVNGALRKAAARHSRDMARRNFFSHTSPGNVSFDQRIRRANYRPRGGWSIGENIAWGSGHLASPASIVRSWMNSPGHRANILNRGFRKIGVGVARGVPFAASAAVSRSGGLYTTDFGSR
nr:CAP domain-containing protein [Conexibacter arvalis]